MNDDHTSDRNFDLFLRTVNLDRVRLEQTTRMSPVEWHALARDRRTQ